MAQNETQRTSAADATLDHMVEELREFEGADKRHWPKWLGVFLIAAIGIAAVWFAQNPTSLPKGRHVDEGAVLQISTPGYGKLSVVPTTFKWQSVAGRSHYTFTIGTVEGRADVLDKMVTTDTIVLNEAEAALLTPGRTYYWKVRAQTRDGKTIGHAESKFSL